MERTYLFYDIETTGLNKAFDQVIQFAAIRTDCQFNELERHEYFIRLNCDVVPSPKAFITHRITLKQLEKGLDEFTAMQKIHALLNAPGTISIGYNTLNFDDEFLRFSFYRNLLPPYTHQYANHCSRMDLYPITVMYFLYRNEVLKWPSDNLKLEHINKINKLASGIAHNAMVDVCATLNLAKCLYQESKMWNYLSGFFDKQIDLERCNEITKQPFSVGILIDGKFGHEKQYQSAVMPLGNHVHYKNQFIWLRLDVESLLQATCNDFIPHTWVVNKKIGESTWILPFKERFMHSHLRKKQKEINHAFSWLQKNSDLNEKIKQHFRNYVYPPISNLDVDASLYEKGFLSFRDQELCKKIHAARAENKIKFLNLFSEKHLNEILIRIVGRHYPEFLTGEEKEKFTYYLNRVHSVTNDNYLDYRGTKRFTPSEALKEINELYETPIDDEQRHILQELQHYLQKNFNAG